MTTQTVQTDKPQAEFVGYQKDERVRGVRAWYVIQAPGFARHLSTVFAPTLIKLGIPIPKTPSYFPDSFFDSVWLFRCENKACHISYLNKDVVIEHVKKTKHYQIIQELISTTKTEPTGELELVNKTPQKAIFIDPEDTLELELELDDNGEPVELEKKKYKIVSIGKEKKKERGSFESIKDSMEVPKKAETIAQVVSSRVVDYSEPKEAVTKELRKILKSNSKKFVPASDEEIKKEVDASVLDFRKKIHAEFPDIPWRN